MNTMSQLYAVYYTLNCCSVIRKKVKSFSRVQLFAAPWTVAHQAPLSLEFSRQEYWSGLPFPSPQNLPDRAVEVRSPALQAEALPSDPPGKPSIVIKLCPVLWLHELQHASLPCPSPSLWICPSSCPLSRWHHLTISSSVALFSSCPQSFPASGFFKWVSSSHQVTKDWSFSFSTSPSNEYSGFISFMICCIILIQTLYI